MKDKRIIWGRLLVVLVLCMGYEVFVFTRLIELQGFRRRGFQIRVKEQAEAKVKVIPRRGKIYDRHLRLLATSVPMRGATSSCVGAGKRIYPLDDVAGNLLGFVGKDGVGLEGIEYEFDPLLSGKPGWTTLGKTPRGHLYPYPGYPQRREKPGQDIVLTIDADLQAIIESALTKRIEETRAKGGGGIIIDPRTGEILALATIPTINPNHWRRAKNYRNLPVQDQFEPGSTFKIVPLSVVVEEKLVGYADTVEDGSCKITIKTKTIHDVKKHPPLTFVEAVWKSSNVAFIKLSNLVGKEKFYARARAFGFGMPTGVSLPGEASGTLSNYTNWDELRFANLAFGQGVSSTLLQVTFAYQAIANKGELLKPIIVKDVMSQTGSVLYRSKPIKVRRVLSPEAAEEISELLVGVIEEGSGELAKVQGLKVAGKTGTANKCMDGKYVEAYISSMVCYFPVDEPIILIAVMIDEPKGRYLGGEVCGPMMRDIIRKIIGIREYRVVREVRPKNET